MLSWLQLGTPGRDRPNLGRPVEPRRPARAGVRAAGRSFPRPTMVRIADVSGGNPFYALEIARAIDGQSSGVPNGPASHAGRSGADQDRAPGRRRANGLLAAACVANPTVEMLAGRPALRRAHHRTARRRRNATARSRSTATECATATPCWPTGSTPTPNPARRRQDASCARRRRHEPELKARHLALAASRRTRSYCRRSTTPRRRPVPGEHLPRQPNCSIWQSNSVATREPSLRSAGHHLRAGDTDQAHAVLEPALDRAGAGAQRALALNLLADCGFTGGASARPPTSQTRRR